jgi:hypothetical protein
VPLWCMLFGSGLPGLGVNERTSIVVECTYGASITEA